MLLYLGCPNVNILYTLSVWLMFFFEFDWVFIVRDFRFFLFSFAFFENFEKICLNEKENQLEKKKNKKKKRKIFLNKLLESNLLEMRVNLSKIFFIRKKSSIKF